MDITQEKVGNVTTFLFTGRLDASSSKAAEDAILKAVEAGDRKLVLDLSGLDYISSVGLRVFILTAKRLKPLGGAVVMSGLQPGIRQVFDVAGFASIFKIFAARDEAVRALSA